MQLYDDNVETYTKVERVGKCIASKKRSSDGAVGLAARASRVLLVGRDVKGGLRDDTVSLTTRASWVLLVSGDVDGDGG